MANPKNPEVELRPLQGFDLGSYPLKFELDEDVLNGFEGVAAKDWVIGILNNEIDSYGVGRVGAGGALITHGLVPYHSEGNPYFPNNLQIDPKDPRSAKKNEAFLEEFGRNLRRGLIPVNVLPWRDHKKFLNDYPVHRVNGFKVGAELIWLTFGEGFIMIDPEEGKFVPVATQFYSR